MGEVAWYDGGEAGVNGLPDLSDLPERGAVVLITGGRRVGKTTLLLAVRQAALAAGLSVGGVLSVARFSGAEKTGIDVMDAASGARRPLATATGTPRGPIHTGHYTFDADGLAAGLSWAGAGQGADLFIVDELGPLELVKGEGWAPVLPMIRARRFGVALVVVRPELLDQAQQALDLSPNALVIRVTPDTQPRWIEGLSAWIAGRARG